MAQADYFFSTTTPDNSTYLAPAVGAAAGNHRTTLNSGTSTNSTYDPFELRVSTGISGASVPVTKEQVERFLIKALVWLYDGETGLDALMAANSATDPIL